MFGVRHAADYCNWAYIFHVFSQGMYMTTIEELENTKTPKMFSVKALYSETSRKRPPPVSDRDHFFGWQFENFLLF